MRGLFRQGAFQQSEKRAESDSFFVICDATVNPQSEIDLGRVNVVVGFAPLKPAEFVVITITQISPAGGRDMAEFTVNAHALRPLQGVHVPGQVGRPVRRRRSRR